MDVPIEGQLNSSDKKHNFDPDERE